MEDKKQYIRLEAVIYVELHDGEKQEEAEDRFLCALPNGMDCVSYKSAMWVPDEEE